TCWSIWAAIFYACTRQSAGAALLERSRRWIIRGSILELLVAVPSHIITRSRDECCAPFGTFWGLTTGLAVMLMAFGPGVCFLFIARTRRLHPSGSLAGKGTEEPQRAPATAIDAPDSHE
ncbi:MAG TPA: hypothetical protein VGE41_12235, partial [Verrucomicrobiae bacterium]